MTSTAVICVTVKILTAMNTRLNQILIDILLPKMQQYGLTYPFL